MISVISSSVRGSRKSGAFKRASRLRFPLVAQSRLQPAVEATSAFKSGRLDDRLLKSASDPLRTPARVRPDAGRKPSANPAKNALACRGTMSAAKRASRRKHGRPPLLHNTSRATLKKREQRARKKAAAEAAARETLAAARAEARKPRRVASDMLAPLDCAHLRLEHLGRLRPLWRSPEIGLWQAKRSVKAASI